MIKGNGSDAPRLRVVPPGGIEREAEADDALIEAFVDGDENAFVRLVRRHQELVLRTVRRYALDRDDLLRLSWRTFVRAYASARRTFRTPVEGHVPFRHWLVRIGVRLSLGRVRDALRGLRAPFGLDGRSRGPAPLERVAETERTARFRRAVLRLPRRQREVLALRLDAELPFAEIAEALDVTEHAAKVSYLRGARRLRTLVAGGGGGEVASCGAGVDPLLGERASGAIELATDARRLAAHLPSCERCRDELAAYQEALDTARLPPPSEEDRAALELVPARALEELRAEPLATSGWKPLALGMVAAAAVAIVGPSVLSALLFGQLAPPDVPAPVWRGPDPEALLQRVAKEHPELSLADDELDERLARAERIADAAYAELLDPE